MVKICPITHYDKESENIYKEYFEKYPYDLHIFQKYAIESIVTGNHVLITAPTGSGKTLPGEFSIDYFISRGKKVIYTTPIKALSNQKFYDFNLKYPHISFGLITGDIKTNPDASCLIMTTEILLNKLYQINSNSPQANSSISFDMDINNDLACVVFDEVHYINDQHRGHVWEQSIMMLPEQVQMVMLSATIDTPENFALWCENRYPNGKKVYLTNRKDRAVPLTHYSFITTNTGIFKAIKDKTQQEEIKSIIDKPFVIQDSKGKFNEEHYFKMNKMLKLFETKQVYVKRQHVLNQVTKYLVENEMLPALCFVFSRKQLEICAKEVTTNLLEFDSKVPYTIRKECEHIMHKFPNYQEYMELPDYLNIVSLLEKGVGIHHSGVLPPFREMTEILYSKGYIKLLFCTETLSVGINMPVKTAIFTDINKFDGENNRVLYSHEYTQASGRSGRLGLDKVGHVFHLNNLFRNVDSVSYKNMMNGKPQVLKSKFKISYNLLLSLIDIGNNNFTDFAEKSMIKDVIDKSLGDIYKNISELSGEIDKLKLNFVDRLNTPKNLVDKYIDLLKNRSQSVNKKRKEIDREIQNMKEMYRNIDNDIKIVEKYNEKIELFDKKNIEYCNTENYIKREVKTVLNLLENEEFIVKNEIENYKLNVKGIIASQIKEVHSLVFSDLIERKILQKLETKEIISILSCFTNIVVSDTCKTFTPIIENNKELINIINNINKSYEKYYKWEQMNEINTGIDYSIQYDLLNYIIEWCNCENAQECRLLLDKLEKEKEIFLGEFIKAILKINNISSEFEKIAEALGEIDFLSKLKEIPELTLKYVATTQSLYV